MYFDANLFYIHRYIYIFFFDHPCFLDQFFSLLRLTTSTKISSHVLLSDGENFTSRHRSYKMLRILKFLQNEDEMACSSFFMVYPSWFELAIVYRTVVRMSLHNICLPAEISPTRIPTYSDPLPRRYCPLFTLSPLTSPPTTSLASSLPPESRAS